MRVELRLHLDLGGCEAGAGVASWGPRRGAV